MIAIWLAAAIAGLIVAVGAARWAVDHALLAASGLRVPPFLIGVTLLAIGTDLPEVANSITASLAGQGDINVGDSIGSAVAQATLILGLLPWITRRALRVGRQQVAVVGSLAVAALAIGVMLVFDGRLGRPDGLFLLAAWGVAVVVMVRYTPAPVEPKLRLPARAPLLHALLAVSGLIVVGLGAVTAVVSLVRIGEALRAPVYLLSFLGLAIGTSLPELIVVVTAVRRGETDLAVGDALGASLLDATLSIGIGPVVAPTAITAALAIRGGLFAVAAVAIATVALATRGEYGRPIGVLLILVYLVGYAYLLGS